MKKSKKIRNLVHNLRGALETMTEQDKALQSARESLREAASAIMVLQAAFTERCETIAKLKAELESRPTRTH